MPLRLTHLARDAPRQVKKGQCNYQPPISTKKISSGLLLSPFRRSRALRGITAMVIPLVFPPVGEPARSIRLASNEQLSEYPPPSSPRFPPPSSQRSTALSLVVCRYRRDRLSVPTIDDPGPSTPEAVSGVDRCSGERRGRRRGLMATRQPFPELGR